ncbi:tRNA lysidine(34) synthetase TilS [Paenibacillus sp. NPDC058071]|uniref:tRNA lysidine(34) synthetase TilS n=1 Tax=Paenibacillus sp. NPDC058071 TaxID=3346326 RepID=UPI0036D9B2E2
METGDRLLFEMARAAKQDELWKRGDRIVVAVSGGPDSMALLHLFSRLAGEEELTILAAHVNHGFRKEESALEAEMVRTYTAELGIPFEMTVLDMPAYIEETGMNPSAASRERRYAFLHEAAERFGADSIALAHHADDQAETIMMRLLRGTGLTGLAGMQTRRREKNVELIRPLLRMNKSDITGYCERHGVPFCIDSSNNERYYFRNVIRLDVLPYLSEFNPQLSRSLRRLAEVAGEEDDWMERQAEAQFAELVASSPGECKVDTASLTALHVALQRRLIKLILNYLSNEEDIASFEMIETIRLAASPESPSTWKQDIGFGLRCIREYDEMRWTCVQPKGSDEQVTEGGLIVIPESSRFETVAAGDCRLTFERRNNGDVQRPKGRDEALFDASQLVFPLRVRGREPGDRISVLGLNGSKKVQDMFVDVKLAPSRRDDYPLVFDAEGRLLWIPGIRRSDHALADPETKDFLFIRLENE